MLSAGHMLRAGRPYGSAGQTPSTRSSDRTGAGLNATRFHVEVEGHPTSRTSH